MAVLMQFQQQHGFQRFLARGPRVARASFSCARGQNPESDSEIRSRTQQNCVSSFVYLECIFGVSTIC